MCHEYPKIVPHFGTWRVLHFAEQPRGHIEAIYRWELGECCAVIDMVHTGEGGQGGIWV